MSLNKFIASDRHPSIFKNTAQIKSDVLDLNVCKELSQLVSNVKINFINSTIALTFFNQKNITTFDKHIANLCIDTSIDVLIKRFIFKAEGFDKRSELYFPLYYGSQGKVVSCETNLDTTIPTPQYFDLTIKYKTLERTSTEFSFY